MKQIAKKVKIESLGEDSYGKQWVIRVDDMGINGLVFLYVFPAESSRKDIRALRHYVLEARLQKLNEELVWLGDINHETSSDTRRPLNCSPIFTNNTDTDCANAKRTNWENRGIGQMLVRYLENWSKQSGSRTIYGLLSPHDNIEKLKHFYNKCGWQIEMFDKAQKIEEGQNFYIGKITKCLVSSQ